MFEENPLLNENEVSRKLKLNDLVKQRRSKFPYVDLTTGKITSYWRALLIASANVLSIPILFSLGLYGYNMYLFKGVTPQDLLPVIFIGIASFIFIDPILGFIYDRIQKRRVAVIRVILYVFASIGLIVSQAYLLSQSTTGGNPAAEFNVALSAALLSYSILNSSSTKKIFGLTPSQKSRRGLIYLEGIMQAVAIFFLAGLPFLVKNGQDECDCGANCTNVLFDECTNCLESCQNFADSTIFQKVSLACTCIFIAINVLSIWFISPRNDEKDLPSLYSFNKRLFDFLKNSLFTITTAIYLLETLVIFTFAIWSGFYGYRQFDAPGVCVSGGSLSLVCTANDYFVLLVILILAFTAISTLVARFERQNILWNLSNLLSFSVGIAIYSAGTDTKGIFVAVLVSLAFALSTLPTSKAYVSDAFYYDEYRTGYVLPHYLSFISNLAVKLAFLIAAGAVISATDSQIGLRGVQQTTHVNTAAATVIVIATCILSVLKYRLSKYNLKVFDKIQVAIQKNRAEGSFDENITFTDPITNKPIRRPFTPKPYEEIMHMIYLDNFATSSEFEKAANQRYAAIKKGATITFWITLFIVAISLILVIIFAPTLASQLGWVLLIPLLLVVLGLYTLIYASNVRTSAAVLLEEVKLDRDYLNKYAFYRKQTENVQYE